MLNIKQVIEDETPRYSIGELIDDLHYNGPVNNRTVENITYYKLFHNDIFSEYEDKILSVLGLFYKNRAPDNLYSFILGSIGDLYKKQYGSYLTPVQASIRGAVEDNKFVSISAPTSAGKSYSIKDYINEQQGDAVIIVPSRALIAEYVENLRKFFKYDKGVMISSFVDYVFTDRPLRRIFVLTPERTRELSDVSHKLNVTLFFFDEAQVSEEKERGLIFDITVRRVNKLFPNAKIIFAHPFVDNPAAQFSKHGFESDESYARSYSHNTVGKIFVGAHKNGKDYYFSPYTNKGHLLNKSFEFNGSFEDYAFSGRHTVLVFVSKKSLYNGGFLKKFKKYIEKFPEVTDSKAKESIESIKALLGADQKSHKSNLVELLQVGVVIHHGSVPLEVRFLVERFIKAGHARICFATSTLAQGINMPFDIVWLANMRMSGDNEQKKCLEFKNLIGRSGRLTQDKKFDYGYVYTSSVELLIKRVKSSYVLDENSLLDSPIDVDNDNYELVTSIVDGTYVEGINLPLSKLERLQGELITDAIRNVINIVFDGGFASNLSGRAGKESREKLKTCFQAIYEASLGRGLSDAELNVFNNAIEIMCHLMVGRSFKEIVGIRFSYISNRDYQKQGESRFSQPANKLPDSTLKVYSLFNKVKSSEVSYDTVVFDTYDYLDTVISFSLKDVFVGAFKIYEMNTHDRDAGTFIDFLNYGTINKFHIMLMRYGFEPENVERISPFIKEITERKIVIADSLSNESDNIKDILSWYMP